MPGLRSLTDHEATAAVAQFQGRDIRVISGYELGDAAAVYWYGTGATAAERERREAAARLLARLLPNEGLDLEDITYISEADLCTPEAEGLYTAERVLAERERRSAARVAVFATLCDNEHHAAHVAPVSDGDSAAEATPMCESCGSYQSNAVPRAEIDGRWLCENCRFTCADCGEQRDYNVRRALQRRSAAGRRLTERYICDDCRETGPYGECPNCGDLCSRDDMSSTEELNGDESLRCPPCHRDAEREYLDNRDNEDDNNRDNEDDNERNDRAIQEYHSGKNEGYSPVASPWSQTHKRFMGVELEVEVLTGSDEASASALLDIVSRAHAEIAPKYSGAMVRCEEDGSLDDGYEIITQPMGLDTHRLLWAAILRQSDLVSDLRSHSTQTCGLHVHVSRAGMSLVQIAKIVCFINDQNNEHLIRAVSRRYNAGFCKTKRKYLASAAQNLDGDRYEAVNICGRQTVEFRIFRGSLKLEAVLAAIEFSNAVVEFCSSTSGYGFHLSTDNFMDFVKTPRMMADTKTLRAYLAARWEQAGRATRTGKPETENEEN